MPITWTEINAEVPQFSIVGRTDGPAESPGDAAAAVVQFLSSAAGNLATNRRIQQALRGLVPLVHQLLPRGSRQGVLAVANIERARFGELEGQEFRECFISGGGFPDPRHAIRHHERAYQLRVGPRSSIGRITRRYFWGVRS